MAQFPVLQEHATTDRKQCLAARGLQLARKGRTSAHRLAGLASALLSLASRFMHLPAWRQLAQAGDPGQPIAHD